MVLRETLLVSIACLFLPAVALPQQLIPKSPEVSSEAVPRLQDVDKIVIPLHELKIRIGVQLAEATGFCLDPACRFIGTNYHVAATMQPRKIKGDKVIQRYLDTGPDDDGATLNAIVGGGSMKFTFGRDLAIFELRYPLDHYHGLGFSLVDLQIGQRVDIYAYPKEGINPIRKLLRFPGRFKGETTGGLFAFDYDLAGDKSIRPGASGGIVVDDETQQIVGVLTGIDLNGEAVAMAVPIQSLAEFVSKVQPFLAQKIFPSANDIPPVPADIYPRFVPSISTLLQHRPEEPPAVQILRAKSQALADGMRNYIAVQKFEWGSDDKQSAAMSAYEIEVVNGKQQFREYPDGNKPLREIPFPALNTTIKPADEWSQMPLMVGTQYGLKIQEAPEAVIKGRHVRIFQYSARIEDGICKWKTVSEFGLFTHSKIDTNNCYGEVWTDEDMNILRVSEHDDLVGKWKDFQAVVTYGFLQQADRSRRVIPVTFSMQAQYNNKIYWCRGEFTNYRVFDSQARVVAKGKP